MLQRKYYYLKVKKYINIKYNIQNFSIINFNLLFLTPLVLMWVPNNKYFI